MLIESAIGDELVFADHMLLIIKRLQADVATIAVLIAHAHAFCLACAHTPDDLFRGNAFRRGRVERGIGRFLHGSRARNRPFSPRKSSAAARLLAVAPP